MTQTKCSNATGNCLTIVPFGYKLPGGNYSQIGNQTNDLDYDLAIVFNGMYSEEGNDRPSIILPE